MYSQKEKHRFVCIQCNNEHIKTRMRGSLDTCPKCIKKFVTLEWKQKFPEKKRALNQRWSEQNRKKDKAMKMKWQKENPKYGRAKTARYLAKKRKALPSWANLEKIQQIYFNCPKGHHVDHIIPLQGKFVSGLHIETNLQYLPAFENRSKSNKFEGNP